MNSQIGLPITNYTTDDVLGRQQRDKQRLADDLLGQGRRDKQRLADEIFGSGRKAGIQSNGSRPPGAAGNIASRAGIAKVCT